MGATLSSYTITVNKLTPDGSGGFWWGALATDGSLYQVNYADTAVNHAGGLFFVDTFYELMTHMHVEGITLPSVDINIRMDELADEKGLKTQFTGLTNTEVDEIGTNFNAKNVCIIFGIYRLLRKFYNRGHMTYSALKNALIKMAQSDKVTRMKAEALMGKLLSDGEIDQAKYDAFWAKWAIDVG